MKLGRIGILAAAVALGTGAPARAIDDMTGTYTGKMSCKGQSGINATKSKADIGIDVLDGETPLLKVTTLPVLPLGDTVELVLGEPLAKPDRAKVGGVDCDLSEASKSGIAIQADVVIKPGSDKGTLKGSLIHYEGTLGIIDVCTFSAKRTSTTAPALAQCEAVDM